MAPQIKAPTTLHPSPPPACLTLDIVHVLEAVAADLLQLLDSSVLGKLLHQLDDALWEGDRAQRGTGRSAASGSFFTPQLDDALLLKAEAREQRARVSVCRCCWNGCKSPCPSPPTGGRRLQSPRHPGARLTLHSLTQPPSLHSPFMQVHVPSLIPPSPPPLSPPLHSPGPGASTRASGCWPPPPSTHDTREGSGHPQHTPRCSSPWGTSPAPVWG